jgi:hypothetical protein
MVHCEMGWFTGTSVADGTVLRVFEILALVIVTGSFHE